jgi:hypothetical protein
VAAECVGLALAAGMRGLLPLPRAKPTTKNADPVNPKVQEMDVHELEEDWGCKCRATARLMTMRSGRRVK